MSTHKQDNVLATYLEKQTTTLLMEILQALPPRHPLVQALVLALLLGSMITPKLLQVQRTFTDRLQARRILYRMVLMIHGSKSWQMTAYRFTILTRWTVECSGRHPTGPEFQPPAPLFLRVNLIPQASVFTRTTQISSRSTIYLVLDHRTGSLVMQRHHQPNLSRNISKLLWS